jgi:hypothetical protein
LREALARARAPGASAAGTRLRLRALYHATFLGLVASTAPSRRRAERFDGIPRRELARAYAEQLARLFLEEEDLGLAPSPLLMRAFGLNRSELLRAPSAVSVEAAERSAERSRADGPIEPHLA